MKKILLTLALLASLAVPAFADQTCTVVLPESCTATNIERDKFGTYLNGTCTNGNLFSIELDAADGRTLVRARTRSDILTPFDSIARCR